MLNLLLKNQYSLNYFNLQIEFISQDKRIKIRINRARESQGVNKFHLEVKDIQTYRENAKYEQNN